MRSFAWLVGIIPFFSIFFIVLKSWSDEKTVNAIVFFFKLVLPAGRGVWYSSIRRNLMGVTTSQAGVPFVSSMWWEGVWVEGVSPSIHSLFFLLLLPSFVWLCIGWLGFFFHSGLSIFPLVTRKGCTEDDSTIANLCSCDSVVAVDHCCWPPWSNRA